MNEVLDDIRSSSSGITERNLLVQIWLQPRATFTYILENCPRKYVTLFLFIGGTTGAISNAITSGSVGLPSILSILLGGIFGWMLGMLFAWLLNVTGRLLGGPATSPPLQTVVAWSEVPIISSLILLIPELLLQQAGSSNSFLFGAGGLIGLISLALSIWSIVLIVIGLTIVQGFSTWRALANFLLAALMMILLAVGLFITFDLFTVL